MDWRAVLAAAQAEPPPVRALDALVAEVWPGARVGVVEPLVGGLGSVLHRIDLEDAPVPAVVLRQLLREFGDDEGSVHREVEALAAAAGAGLAVPTVHWADPGGALLGRPALLLALVPGRPLVGALPRATARRAMATTLHGLATVPVADARHLPRLGTLHAVVTRFGPVPATSDLVDAAALHARVLARGAAFEPGGGLVHLDLHAGNVLWDGGAVTGILDWPGAAIGNPLADEAYLWFDTCLAHGRPVADALQQAVDEARPHARPTAEQVRLWRLVALERGLPSPGVWTEAYRAMGIDVDEATVEERFVALVEDHIGED